MLKSAFVGLVGALAIGALVWPSERELCSLGHPTKRPPVTYAGLRPRNGFQRDHFIPLCLRGPDTKENVWYQPLDEAAEKDLEEWTLCEAMCRGEISLTQAVAQIRQHWTMTTPSGSPQL